ncbi:sensor histidine kinase [Chryseobacterium sp. MYb328]|uniref:sensor histidine kinase n=1 Tax=Chryseobacterium sp. MYb328 TaxID=2745231 RepID=UPI0030A1785F
MKLPKREIFFSNTVKRVIIVLSAFILMYLVSFLIDPYCKEWQFFFDQTSMDLLKEFGCTLIACIIITEFSITFSNKLNKYIPWTESPIKRLAVELTLNIVMVLIVNLLLSFYTISDTVKGRALNMSTDEARSTIQWILISMAISMMIMAVNTGNYLVTNWKNESLKASKLNQLAMESELQALKLQIDPHFVFNNLSVLSELILEDPNMGYEYAENFTKIYRYMLINSKKDTISLEEEMKFLNAYIVLIKYRQGNGVCFNINISDKTKNLSLPPMTMQLLVENALKHNRTNKKHPLKIRIYDNEKDEITIENTLIPMGKIIASSNIGLKNIQRRYSLLSVREPKINNDGENFVVKLPLLKL